mgnify:CR=1 FL=1
MMILNVSIQRVAIVSLVLEHIVEQYSQWHQEKTTNLYPLENSYLLEKHLDFVMCHQYSCTTENRISVGV